MNTSGIFRMAALLGIMAASTGGAGAAIIVSNVAPVAPNFGKYPRAGIVITSSFTESFTVPNIERLSETKYFWMEVTMNTMNGFPQAPGDVFNPAQWPTVFAAGSTTSITGAADLGFGNPSSPWKWYLTATIIPQPASEQVTFPTGWWSTWGGNVTRIEVITDCIPEPSCGAVLGVFLLTAAGYRRRQRRAD